MFDLTPMEALRVEQSGGVLHVTLNRPYQRNAMSLRMVSELIDVLSQAESSAEVRVIVLRGAGGHFCARADLKDMAAARISAQLQPHSTVGPDPIAQANAQFGNLCVAYAKSPFTIVALLEGTVMGGGVGLACVADVALASETVVFRLPVTGGRTDAQQALRIGLIHEVYGEGAIDTALARVLAEILACAPLAVAHTNSLMARARLVAPIDLVQDAAAIFSCAAQGLEGQEGTSAFLQKRKPSWATP